MSTIDEIKINMRNARAPYETWPATGHAPFEIHGEHFAITKIPCALKGEQQWRATHIETGMAVPYSASTTIEGAREAAKDTLAKITPEKLQISLAKGRALFANGSDQPPARG